jgi:hypothetical protein
MYYRPFICGLGFLCIFMGVMLLLPFPVSRLLILGSADYNPPLLSKLVPLGLGVLCLLFCFREDLVRIFKK